MGPRIWASITSTCAIPGHCRCGHRMTLSTGKSGAYRYYKCISRRNQDNHACSSRNLPTDRVDDIVLEQLANKVLEPNRLQALMEQLRQRIQASKDSRNTMVTDMERQMKANEDRQGRLQNLKTAREALLIRIAEARIAPVPAAIEYLKPSQVELLGKALRSKLLGKDHALAKRYPSLMIDEIVVNDGDALIRGSHAALAHAMHQMKMCTSNQVPTFLPYWRARQESNL